MRIRTDGDDAHCSCSGAGPIGLAAAANLIERGIDFVIFEAGTDAAASVRSWGHTRLFSPWRHLVDPAATRLLEQTGWLLPDPDRAPTGTELVELYLEPLAALEPIASRLRTSTTVRAARSTCVRVVAVMVAKSWPSALSFL